jgi:hypothetical protein
MHALPIACLLLVATALAGCEGSPEVLLDLRTDLSPVAALDVELAGAQGELDCAQAALSVRALCVHTYTLSQVGGLAVNAPVCSSVAEVRDVADLAPVLTGFLSANVVLLPSDPGVDSYLQVFGYADDGRTEVGLCGLSPPLSAVRGSGSPLALPLYVFCAPAPGGDAERVFADYCEPVEFVAIDPAVGAP